jgi:hypothetical protein
VPRTRLGIPDDYTVLAEASRALAEVVQTAEGPVLIFQLPGSAPPPPEEVVEEAFALATRFSSLCRMHPGLAQAIGVRLVAD